MASLTVYDRKGAEVGSYAIEPTDLVPRINKQLLHDAVVMYEANLRQGTFGTKTRAMVAGTTKKMYRQKGTGNARAGSRRSGIRRGGGHIFAKRPRDFGYRLPRKALQLATRMALASKIQDNQLTLIDDFKLGEPKTREMAAILKALKHDGGTLLIATAALDQNVYKSARNIAGVSISPVSDLNALTVLKPRRLLFTKEALEHIRKQAGSKQAGNGAAGGKKTKRSAPRKAAAKKPRATRATKAKKKDR